MVNDLNYISLFYNKEIYLREKIIIVTHSNLNQEETNYISKILQSVGVQFFKVLLQEGLQKIDLNSLPNHYLVLIIGEIDGTPTKPNCELQQHKNDINIIHCPDLSTLSKNNELKQVLWKALKVALKIEK